MFVLLFSPIYPSWDIVNDNDTDVISPFHIRNFLDIHISTQTTLLDYPNYLRYLQQSLKSFLTQCKFIALFKVLST